MVLLDHCNNFYKIGLILRRTYIENELYLKHGVEFVESNSCRGF